MLTVSAVDVYDNEVIMTEFVYVSVNQECDVPADDLTVIIPLTQLVNEFKIISLKENNQLIFQGIVDEQQIISDNQSAYIKVVARSMAALLLDNESKPANYTNLSTGVFFERHLKPMGFEAYKGEDTTFYGSFNVTKGTTQWKALYSFCINAYGTIPRIEADGTVNFKGVEEGEILVFSNYDGIEYNSIKENRKHCELISKVLVKASESKGYITLFQNDDAVKSGVNRVRFLDATGTTSINIAEKMLENSVNASYEITLICPTRLINILGARAYLEDELLGSIENLYIHSVHYKLNSDGEYTTIKLRKEK